MRHRDLLCHVFYNHGSGVPVQRVSLAVLVGFYLIPGSESFHPNKAPRQHQVGSSIDLTTSLTFSVNSGSVEILKS